MNRFIRITNDVLDTKLKNKIHIVSVMYYTFDQVMTINVKYRRVEDYKELGFTYSYHEVKHDSFIMETDFKCFLNSLFKLD